jgi:hypothetical protein
VWPGVKAALAFSVAVVSLLVTACRGSSSSPASPSTSAGANSVESTAPADLARCLSGVSVSACRWGSRPAALTPTTAPGPPSNLIYHTDQGGVVNLAWTPSSTGDLVATYVIEAGSATGLANLASIATNSTVPNFHTSGVANGRYYVRVRAQNAGGTSAPSNEVLVVVGGGSSTCTSPPNQPTGLTASVKGGTVLLSWRLTGGACGAATSYLVQFGSRPGATDATLTVTNSGYTASGVPAGTYYVRVIGVNANGPSAPSEEIVFTVAGAAETDINGRWTGVVPNGLAFKEQATTAFAIAPELPQQTPVCDATDNLVFDLVQSGGNVTGTVTADVRTTQRSDGCQTFGDGTPRPVTEGRFFPAPTSEGVSTVQLAVWKLFFSGSAVGGRIAGTLKGNDGSDIATFVVVRQ